MDQCEFDIDESEVANLLINEIKKESRKNEIDKINDLRISKIRDLTEVIILSFNVILFINLFILIEMSKSESIRTARSCYVI